MITFKQYLLEEPEDQDLGEILKRDCDDFLHESNWNGVLFRGLADPGTRQGNVLINNISTPFYKKSVRSDRKPLSSKKKFHDAIDEWFFENFGIRARSQTMFATGEQGAKQIAAYGIPSIVIPIGEFDYVWSDGVIDLYDSLEHREKSFEDENGNVDKEKLASWLRFRHYEKTGLERAVRSHNEVMVQCKEYYVFPLHHKEAATNSVRSMINDFKLVIANLK